ncbi:hypothetical protein [Cutibacterium avidum]|nr:hypothetical protein [Cutibacterium avidum]
MTDAGIWADDDAAHVAAICYQASRKDPNLAKGCHALDLLIIDQYVPF